MTSAALCPTVRYLVSKNRIEDATVVLMKLRGYDRACANDEILELQEESCTAMVPCVVLHVVCTSVVAWVLSTDHVFADAVPFPVAVAVVVVVVGLWLYKRQPRWSRRHYGSCFKTPPCVARCTSPSQ